MSSSSPTCQYCGPNSVIPPGYDIRGTPYSCLRSGIGVGKFGERRAWQRRMGFKVDPEYVSKCGDNRVYGKKPKPPRNRRSRSRAPSRSSPRRYQRSRSRHVYKTRR